MFLYVWTIKLYNELCLLIWSYKNTKILYVGALFKSQYSTKFFFFLHLMFIYLL